MTNFDAISEAVRIKKHTKAIRKRPYSGRLSKLDKHKGQILALHKQSCTASEIQRWLKAKRMNISLSTVTRYLKKHG